MLNEVVRVNFCACVVEKSYVRRRFGRFPNNAYSHQISYCFCLFGDFTKFFLGSSGAYE